MTTAQELYVRILPHALSAYTAKTSDMDSAKQMADNLTRACVQECGNLGLLADRVPSTQQHQYERAPVAPSPEPQQSGSVGLAKFAEAPYQGGVQQGLSPLGTPGQPSLHYAKPGMQNPQAVQAPAAAPPVATPWYPPHLAYLHQPSAPAAQPAQPKGGFQVPQAQVALGEGSVSTPLQPQVFGNQTFVPPAGSTFQPPAQAGVMTQVTQIATPQGHSALGTDGVISQPSQRPTSKDVVVNPAGQLVVTPVGAGGSVFVPEHIVR